MILVVGAAVLDRLTEPRRVLATRRRDTGGWEFPGGKVEPGEDPVAALRRELREELSLEVRLGAELSNPAAATWPVSDRYQLRVWLVAITAGVAQPGPDHDEVRWLTRETLDEVAWLPADRMIVHELHRLL